MRKYITLALMLSIALLAAACSDGTADKQESTPEDATSEQQKKELTFDNKERVAEDTSVVSVNGNEIKGDDYNSVYTRVKTMLHNYGQDVSDLDFIKEQTITLLVDEELIRQDAADKGIEVTEEEAQTELEAIKKETGEEQFNNMLEQFQMNEEDFKDQLINDLITVQYMDNQFEIEVTDEEIQEYYDKLKEQNEEIEELAEIKERIESAIYSQKQSEQLQVKVEELRKDAEVETLI
ncbi:SurA N-terminal domain-containing protein [Oceanobacillus zhaokaii]|nr:SurA N-terminal domain-containing protein [Oceanobacillus zhaokaii]